MGKGPKFNYTNTNWEIISPEYKTCKDGREQSPINIDDASIVPTPATNLFVRYNITGATLINYGMFVEVHSLTI